eukprot:TRINITY_DN4941_c0_g1_i3.p3 TRINITY_DN4941_c0_g1~~TRINITY_DN4941_c0_g1_i3.p3  ORF type:complete len:226 (+),score=-5.26 TRINITY_DN4941_c0_g1_i3:758-1435(+)
MHIQLLPGRTEQVKLQHLLFEQFFSPFGLPKLFLQMQIILFIQQFLLPLVICIFMQLLTQNFIVFSDNHQQNCNLLINCGLVDNCQHIDRITQKYTEYLIFFQFVTIVPENVRAICIVPVLKLACIVHTLRIIASSIYSCILFFNIRVESVQDLIVLICAHSVVEKKRRELAFVAILGLIELSCTRYGAKCVCEELEFVAILSCITLLHYMCIRYVSESILRLPR